MTDNRDGECAEAALSRAMYEESQHFLAVLRSEPDAAEHGSPRQALLDEHAAAMFGAAVGEAKRLVRERGEVVAEVVRRLAGIADAIEEKLSHRLYLPWRVHFVDGRALSEYAAAAGLDAAAALADYRSLVRTLVTVARERTADVEVPNARRSRARQERRTSRGAHRRGD